MMSSQHQSYMAVHKASVEIALLQIHRANRSSTISSLRSLHWTPCFSNVTLSSSTLRLPACAELFVLFAARGFFLFVVCGFILFAACGLFCSQCADLFVCSVRIFLFVVCGLFYLQRANFFYLQRADLFCSQCADLFICWVRIYFVRSVRIYLVCSAFSFVRCVTSCYMEEYYQERCVPYGLPYCQETL